jgi:hypothetical protein
MQARLLPLRGCGARSSGDSEGVLPAAKPLSRCRILHQLLPPNRNLGLDVPESSAQSNTRVIGRLSIDVTSPYRDLKMPKCPEQGF